MARTLNPTSHAQRRDAFIGVGERLIQTKGYEQFSVQDVLDEVGASKGAFYHYFDSKGALLDAVVDQMADAVTVVLGPIVADPCLSAVEKLEALSRGLARFKAEQKELVLAILRVWLSDENAIVRDKTRRLVSARLVPWLDRIIREGIDEGVFTTRYPEMLARTVGMLVQGMNELAGELWVARQMETITFEEVERTFDAYVEAFERIVGLSPGSLVFLDQATLRFWFG